MIKDPGSSFGSSMVTDMGSSISSLSSKELKNLDVSVICSSWDKLKNSKFQAHDVSETSVMVATQERDVAPW